MGEIKSFLESSTIHGLAYLTTPKKYLRLFWTLVVIAGFTGAGVLIYKSFQSWDESPVTTTIETHPIAEIKFPKVTVCPPKNTFTDLNYDLITIKNTTLDNDTRNEIINYVSELLYDHLYESAIKANVTMLVDNDRYYNWYHGYNTIELQYGHPSDGNYLYYSVNTAATSGTISTKHFDEQFNAEKVLPRLAYSIIVHAPRNISNVTTLHFEIEKISMTDLSTGEDVINFGWMDDLKEDVTRCNRNYTLTGRGSKSIYLQRNVITPDILKQKLNWMPGFRLTWYYSGLEVEAEALYYKQNKAFIRNGSFHRSNIYVIFNNFEHC